MRLMRCACGLVQLGDDTRADLMYCDGYGYRSGVNETMVAHLRGIVAGLRSHVRAGDRVLDIGCNDGTLLRQWGELAPGVERFGCDPIGEDVQGATVERRYFQADGREYKVITSIAMFYDLPDPVKFARDVAHSLTPDGVWCLEVGYSGNLLAGCWDGICHEHLEYYARSNIRDIASRARLQILSHRFTPTNGGSLLVTLGRGGFNEDTEYMKRERWKRWDMFSDIVRVGVAKIRGAVLGKRTYVLGASTKGNTLLQACGFTDRDIVAAVDRNPDKIGRFTPGSNIPIISEDDARKAPPEQFLVLPYHFKDSILRREAALRDKGVRFIFPMPQVEIC